MKFDVILFFSILPGALDKNETNWANSLLSIYYRPTHGK